jgi:hypothetical protein
MFTGEEYSALRLSDFLLNSIEENTGEPAKHACSH